MVELTEEYKEKIAKMYGEKGKNWFENIDKIEIKALGGRKIILSLGACIYDGTGDISYDTLYSKADAAMYRSKKQQGFCATVHGAADEVFIP